VPDITIPVNELTSFDLPKVCIISGARSDVVFKPVKFAWYPRWVPALIIVNLLVAAIVAFALTKRAKGELPFTEHAYRRWRLGNVLRPVSWLFAIFAVFGSAALMAGDHLVLGLFIIALGVGAPIGTWFVFVRNQSLAVQKIADGVIVLRSPSANAALEFKQHLRGGAALPAPPVQVG
jgi:hypothetical protein